jgi:hypothetical protein
VLGNLNLSAQYVNPKLVYVIVRLKGSGAVVDVWTGPAGRGRLARYSDVVR